MSYEEKYINNSQEDLDCAILDNNYRTNQMKSLPRRTFVTIILVFMFIFYLLMYFQITNREGERNSGNTLVSVVGWGYNATRDVSQYVINHNLSAHIIPDNFCDSESFLIIMVCSRPSNLLARNAIRDTWGHDRNPLISLYFLLGETANTSLQYDVMLESEQYGDIIEERFIDSYNNLTIKSVVMLKLISSYCLNSTKYLLKIDDDMYVNVHLMVEMLSARNSTKNLLLGKLICGAKPIKDINNKWYSPRYMYSGKVYPNYVSGTGYLMSVDVADQLYKSALGTPLFHLEDVYITGICAKHAKIKPHNNPRFSYQKITFDPCLIKKLYTVHHLTPSDIRRTYAALHDPDMIKECASPKSYFNVNRWIMNNILKVNKTYLKNKCE